MDKIKFLFLGALGGVAYAFISFYLITPQFIHYPLLLGGWAVQGFLFALFFILIGIPFRKFSDLKLINAGIGMASGLLSFSPAVAITWYNSVIIPERSNIIVLAELKRSIASQIGYQALGYMLLGAVVGIAISKKIFAHNNGADTDAA